MTEEDKDTSIRRLNINLAIPANPNDKFMTEEEIIRTILFLTECLRQKKNPEDILNFTSYCYNVNSKIRYLALKICHKDKNLALKYFKIDDPSASIRCILIRKSRCCSEIVQFLKDFNTEVKLSALKAFSRLKISKEDQNKYISHFWNLINDRSYEVRLSFAKVLKNFNQLNSELFLKLFDKEDVGTFIFAAEDEYEDVRKQSILSLSHIISKDVANCAFNFLVDILGDDFLEIRETAMKVLCSICKKFTIKKSSNDLFSVLCCFREGSPILRKYLLKVLSRIYYDSVNIVESLLNYKLEDNELLPTVKKIVRKNFKEFQINHLKQFFQFSTQEDRSSYNIKYMVDLTILKELNKKMPIELDNKTRSEFKILESLTKKGNSNMICLEKLKEKILLFLQNYNSDDKIIDNDVNENSQLYQNLLNNFLNDTLKNLRMVTSIGKFLKNFILSLPKSLPSIYLILFKFGYKKEFLISLLKNYQINLNSNQFNVKILRLIVDLIDFAIQNNKALILNEYKFELPLVITRQGDLPVEFFVDCVYNKQHKNVFFVIQNESQKLYYNANDKIHVVIDDCPPYFTTYMACKLDETDYTNISGDGLLYLTSKVIVAISEKF